MNAAQVQHSGSVLRWQPVWVRWAALVWACLLILVGLAAWRGGEVSSRLQQVEQEAVLQEIGRAIAPSLARTQELGIPLRDAVGLEPWLASQITASPQMSGLAVTLASGELLAQHGVPSDILLALRRPGVQASDGIRLPWVRVGITTSQGGTPLAWLHVVGTPQLHPWTQVLESVALAAACGLVATLWLRWWLRRRVGRPLVRIRHHLQMMASGQLVSGHVALPEPGGHALAQLDRALAKRWTDLQLHQAAVLQKLNEVRAAHFDTEVLARIDALAQPLLQSPLTGADPRHTTTLSARRWWRWSLNRRVAVAMFGAWVLVLCGLVGLEHLHASQAEDAQARAEEMKLRLAFEKVLGQDLARLSALVRPSVVDAVLAAGPQTVQAILPTKAHWWWRLGLEEAQTLAGPAAEPSPPTRTLLDELSTRQEGTQGIWADTARVLQLGAARRVTTDTAQPVTVVVAQPLALTLEALATSLEARWALADHRGQPLGVDSHNLIHRWQQVHRETVKTSARTWLVSVPMLSHTGHTLGHLVAELPASDADPDRSTTLALGLLVWAALGACIWFVLQQLRALGQAVSDVGRLAESTEVGTEGEVHVGTLRRNIARVENRLEVLRALRRSRERQGRRQARFIRHQMLELANRLDESARADVLHDLERIESASLHPEADVSPPTTHVVNPHFERMVDEVGVLALGFQNLVGRVGDQYQQLGLLVQELREALRVKTQFIAIQQELEIARKMQLAFLPHDFSHQAGVELHGVTQPAREVGGDFYDFFRIDEHHLAVLVADVSGKGVPAAFFMAVSRTLMRAVAQFSKGPADCLQRLNDLLAADNDEMMFVTLFYAVIDTRDGHVVYSNAGHNPPYVVRHSGGVEEVPSLGNMALAVMPDMPFAEKTLVLAPGDALFLYTDGVTEASAPDGSWFGEPRLEHFLATEGRPAQVDSVSRALIETVKQFEAGGAQSDDITCLVVRLASSPPNPDKPMA